MFLPRTDAFTPTEPPGEQLADSDAVTTVSFASIITIDDSWLEAVLDNLALAKLSRLDGVALLRQLEELEHQSAPATATGVHLLQIVVGDHFDAELNAHGMRAPNAMTADNALDTIERAARHFVAEGHAAALRQLVFFVSGNLEEVLAEEEEEEEERTE